ncbi:MAG TPA: serpin family protein, partial [Oceanipulchritudo sp.]|nr:serpin family protein [Oceanipulchritudo sp.]
MKSGSILTALILNLSLFPGMIQGAESISPEARSLVDGNTRFALDLYRDLASTDSEANLFISPWSLSTALGMAWAGAVGETADEMAQALHFPFDQDTTHPLFGEIINNMNAFQEEGKLVLHTANALWPAAGHEVLPEYTSILQSEYGAHAESLDFRNNTEASREHINEWVSDKTAERIPDLIPQGMLSAGTAIVLTNAIYFKGAWKTLFDPEKTVEGVFSAADGSSIDIPMMSLEEDLPFYEDSTVTLVTLPYHDERLEAVLLSPRSGSIATLESRLTPQRLQEWLDQRSTIEVTVRIPRFGLSDKRELSEQLKALGMERAFVPYEADFSGIFGQPDIFISFVIHETFLQVREEGTEAAGATGIGFEFTSVGPFFDGSRPFLFL